MNETSVFTSSCLRSLERHISPLLADRRAVQHTYLPRGGVHELAVYSGRHPDRLCAHGEPTLQGMRHTDGRYGRLRVLPIHLHNLYPARRQLPLRKLDYLHLEYDRYRHHMPPDWSERILLLKTKSLTKRRRLAIYAGAAAALAALIAYFAYQRLGPPSPEAVLNRTIHALEAGDTAALCRLANPKEIQRLHLTPEAVSGILHQTLWRAGRPVFRHAPKRITPQPVDVATWLYRDGGAGKSGRFVYIPAIMDPDGHWYLNLSRLLEVSFLGQTPDMGVHSMQEAYREMAMTYGTKGLRGHFGGWVMFSAPGVPQNWQPTHADE